MSDQLELLIKEIAAKHGIAVARDDPILVLQTINYRLLQDSAAAQQEQLEKFKEEMEGVSQRWQNDAREKAEKIVNASLAASATAMEALMIEAGKQAALKLHGEVTSTVTLTEAIVDRAHKAARLNFVATVCSIAGVAALLISTF